jgi:hypothetical protein
MCGNLEFRPFALGRKKIHPINIRWMISTYAKASVDDVASSGIELNLELRKLLYYPLYDEALF